MSYWKAALIHCFQLNKLKGTRKPLTRWSAGNLQHIAEWPVHKCTVTHSSAEALSAENYRIITLYYLQVLSALSGKATHLIWSFLMGKAQVLDPDNSLHDKGRQEFYTLLHKIPCREHRQIPFSGM